MIQRLTKEDLSQEILILNLKKEAEDFKKQFVQLEFVTISQSKWMKSIVNIAPWVTGGFIITSLITHHPIICILNLTSFVINLYNYNKYHNMNSCKKVIGRIAAVARDYLQMRIMIAYCEKILLGKTIDISRKLVIGLSFREEDFSLTQECVEKIFDSITTPLLQQIND